jgi:type IV secretory pathway VirJ component
MVSQPRFQVGAIAVGALLATVVPGELHAAGTSERFAYGPFGEVTIYAPTGTPDQCVLFLSGDGGWNLGVVPMAERLRDLGALVAGIDIRAFQRNLDAGPGACAYPAGSLEQLARDVQLRAHMREYKRPILVGYSSGATMVYVALATAPVETFAGGISLGFCPDIAIHKAPCRGRGLASSPRRKGIGFDLEVLPDLGVPWMVLQGDIDQVCNAEATRRFVSATDSGRLFWLPKVGHGFGVTRRWDGEYVEAYREIARTHAKESAPTPSASAVADLPLVEVPAAKPGDDLFAVLVTGDGGWAGIDKAIGAQLAADGVPVVGWSSLRYFWSPRTPEGAAADLARIIAHYRGAWGKSRVLVLGYSFGADVLPFLVNRLPASEREAVSAVALIGLSPRASFEFHVAGWLAEDGDPRYPTAAEVDRMKLPSLCLVGSKESDSACYSTRARVVALPGGHHFGGDYARLSRTILDFVAETRSSQKAAR